MPINYAIDFEKMNADLDRLGTVRAFSDSDADKSVDMIALNEFERPPKNSPDKLADYEAKKRAIISKF